MMKSTSSVTYRMFTRVVHSRLLIFVIALLVRVLAVAHVMQFLGTRPLYVSNEPSHIAASLAAGMGFSAPYAGAPIAATAQQPPLYPLILAGIFKLLAPWTVASAWAALILNALAGAVVTILIYAVGKMYFDTSTALLSAWAWALWPYEAGRYATLLSNFCLAGVAFLGFILFFEKARRSDRQWWLLGILAGCLALLQTTFVAVFIIYAGWMIRYNSRAFARFTLAFFLCVLPWTVRNYVRFREVIPIRDNFGLELWVGNRPAMEGTKDFSGDFPDHDPSLYGQLGETKFMRTKLNESLTFIKEKPGAFVFRVAQRIVEFWTIPVWTWTLVSIGAFAGMVISFRRAWPLGVALLAFPIVYYITHVWAPYRHPIEPIILLFCCHTVVYTKDRVSKLLLPDVPLLLDPPQFRPTS